MGLVDNDDISFGRNPWHFAEVGSVSSQELNFLFQQIGEVVQGLRALSDAIQVRHEQADKIQDLLRNEIAVLRRDQQDVEEKLDCAMCVLQHDVERLRSDSASNGQSIEGLICSINELHRPVAEMIAWRARAAGLILGIGVFGSAVLWLVEPVYRWIVEHNYLKQ